MYDERINIWTIMLDVTGLFLPMLLLSLAVAFVLSPLTLFEFARLRTAAAAERFSAQAGFIFSFCVVGFVVGMIIRLLGGFSLGTTKEGTQPDTFQFIATLAASFAAIAGLFLGEAKLQSTNMARPIGAGAAIFMMMIGYFYLTEIFAQEAVLSALAGGELR